MLRIWSGSAWNEAATKEISKNNCYYFAGRGCTVPSASHRMRIARVSIMQRGWNPPESIRRTRLHAPLDSLIFARRLTYGATCQLGYLLAAVGEGAAQESL